MDEINASYKRVFDSDGADVVLDDLGKRFCMKATTFVPDTNEMAFREGQRSVLLFIHSMLEDKQAPTNEE
jgi:hypothetical protein